MAQPSFRGMQESIINVYAEGPITDPRDLGPALQRAIAAVKRGESALVDVVTQAR